MLKGKWIVIKEQRDVARLVFVLFCSKSLFKVFSQIIISCSIKAVAVTAKIRAGVMCRAEMGDG